MLILCPSCGGDDDDSDYDSGLVADIDRDGCRSCKLLQEEEAEAE